MNIDSWIFYLYQGRIWVRSTRSFYYRYRIIYSIRGSVIERLKMISSEYWLKHELFDWIIRLQREIYESMIRNSIVWWKGRKNNIDLDRFERGLNEPFMIIFFSKNSLLWFFSIQVTSLDDFIETKLDGTTDD